MFSDSERKVFRYVVGGAGRYADPLAVRRALQKRSGGEYYNWLADSAEPDGPQPATPGLPADPAEIVAARRASALLGALDAQERVLDCIRFAFDLPAFDPATGEGVVEGDCLALMDDFEEWLEKNEPAAAS